jgi:hypothetical protein
MSYQKRSFLFFKALGSSSTVDDVAADANVDLTGKYAIVTGANSGTWQIKGGDRSASFRRNSWLTVSFLRE